MTVAVNFSFSSSIPPWTIHAAHSPQRNTSQRATTSSLTIPNSNSSSQQTITRSYLPPSQLKNLTSLNLSLFLRLRDGDFRSEGTVREDEMKMK
ncbi:hypothetical protein QVD17_08004 [Tagetes erecta]|uniref:Uncharacterized protein n=1 Tax=Tagetes erecta TaxID=13708 RepID=A0AAD8KZP3_TARER|nr:hypothetical protein QVD17_08004 [Tagetes erecta]